MGSWTGFVTLLRREMLRFLTLPNQTILPSLVTMVLYIVVFGFVIGSRIADIEGHRYIDFIFPGLLLMSAVIMSFQNAATSLFIARWEHFIEDLLVAPISFFGMVVAYILASSVHGLINGVLIVALGALLIHAPLAHPLLFLLALFLSSVVFSALGLIVGLWAERWDNLAVYQNYLITPLTFLGGVFYSTALLPPSLKWSNELNPIFYMVDAVRFSVLGSSEVSLGQSLWITTVLAVVLSAVALELFRRGYHLRT